MLWFLFSTSYFPYESGKIISEKTLGNAALFNEFGRLRSFSSDTQKIPVIITPVLKYAANNTPLYEEICQKKGKLQNCITSYFTDKTKKQFFQIGEENAKKQILQKLNENLSMGKIVEIYFEELIFLE